MTDSPSRNLKTAQGVPASTDLSQPIPTLDELLSQVALDHGITVELLRCKRRGGGLPAARADFCRRAWDLKVYSSIEIGNALHRDHSIVLYYAGNLTSKKPGGKWNSKGTAFPAEVR